MTSKTIKIPDYVVVNCAKAHPDNVCEHCRKRNKCIVYRNDVCKELADSLANEITKSIEIAILSEMMKNDNEPIIDIQNVGQHDADNSFLLDKSIKNQYNQWKTSHPGCVPIGVCPELLKIVGKKSRFIALVYEDRNGNRYYTHVPAEWFKLNLFNV